MLRALVNEAPAQMRQAKHRRALRIEGDLNRRLARVTRFADVILIGTSPTHNDYTSSGHYAGTAWFDMDVPRNQRGPAQWNIPKKDNAAICQRYESWTTKSALRFP